MGGQERRFQIGISQERDWRGLLFDTYLSLHPLEGGD